ncbi:response regulator transcription factor [Halonatronum saccharophilum]|uniref:response regulator transcription factor n=1 Tax=Halonatronum saccharophilum TaxID=150060 RepID=UPI000482D432|nr:response regulator transcription factor [Halonatronum saccharophilum]
MKEIRVLIADDQSLIRDGLKMLLDLEEGIEVVDTAKDGMEAYDMVRKHKPNLVLMDIRMPKMNGILSIKKIKNNYPATKIIVLTTFDDKDYIIDVFNYGAEGYILKDIDSEKLIKVIRDAINDELLLPVEIAKKLIKEEKKETIALTTLEKEVAMMLAKGRDNKQIAKSLNIAYGTARNKVSSIYNKIGFSNRSKAVLYLKEYFDNEQ